MNHDDAQFSRSFQRVEGPTWRFTLAQRLASDDSPWLREQCDQLVCDTAQCIRRKQTEGQAEGESLVAETKIIAAIDAWEMKETRRSLTILVLADCPTAEIAERLGLEEEMVITIEALFLDIRERRESRSWINTHVIQATMELGESDLANKYRAAYWGGSVVAMAILDAEERIPFEEVERIHDAELLLHMKMKAALELPLDNSVSAQRFIESFCDYNHRRKRLEFEQEKFRQRCEDSLRKHDLAEQRIQATLERQKIRSEERLRMAELKIDLEKMKATLAASESQKPVHRKSSDRTDVLTLDTTVNGEPVPKEDQRVVVAGIAPLTPAVVATKGDSEMRTDFVKVVA
jgi:hypothetical protein